MPDMLVRLTDLPPVQEAFECRTGQTVSVRRAMTYEQGQVLRWIGQMFSPAWADECRTAFGSHPVGCFIAIAKGDPIGFCCYDVTLRGFAGPIGVASKWQRSGIGRTLLVAVLNAMRSAGYGYAIIGNVASPGFFERACGAVVIESTKRDIYPGKLLTRD